jgi:magnesium transporter
MDSIEINSEDLQYNQETFEKLLALALEHDHYQEAKDIITEAHIADLAGFLNRANSQQKIKALSIIDDKKIADLIIELDQNVIGTIIEMLGYKKSANIINSLDVDEAIYVLESLEDDLNKIILTHLKGKTHKELKEGLAYPERSAGRLMQKKFVSVPDNWTIKQTIEHIQKEKNKHILPAIFYEIFVTNSKFIPIGSVPLSTLIAAPHDGLINSIIQPEIKSVKTDLDEDEVSYLFKKYGLVTVPVVNKSNRLVGVITLEDALDVIDKNAEENIMHMGGVREDDVHLNLIEVISSRFPWLLISLITAIISSLVINIFHDTIHQVVILSAIMPIVAGISGNAGTQTMTVTVLSLSSKELTALNMTRVIMKQIISCSCNGLILAIIGGIILGALHNNISLSLAFGFAVTLNFALAGFLGSVIPIILNKIGFDPAIASPVFVTTLTDMLSFAIFLSVASKMLT